MNHTLVWAVFFMSSVDKHLLKNHFAHVPVQLALKLIEVFPLTSVERVLGLDVC